MWHRHVTKIVHDARTIKLVHDGLPLEYRVLMSLVNTLVLLPFHRDFESLMTYVPLVALDVTVLKGNVFQLNRLPRLMLQIFIQFPFIAGFLLFVQNV